MVRRRSGGPIAAVNSRCQAVAQGQWAGRCSVVRRAERRDPGGMLISWARIVPVVASCMRQDGEGAGGAGQVERDRGQHQPGGVGRELPGGQMRQRAVLQIGDDLLDDRVPPMIGLGLEHRQRGIGEHGVMPPDREQLTLERSATTWSGLASRTRRTINRAVTCFALALDRNAVNGISATSASEIHCRSCSS